MADRVILVPSGLVDLQLMGFTPLFDAVVCTGVWVNPSYTERAGRQ